MKIKLFPFLGYDDITATVSGDVITINGEPVDLSPLADGFRILGSAIGNKFFVPTEYVERINGELHVTLFLHVEADTDEQWRNPPEPNVLSVTEGIVPFPDTSPPVVKVPEFTPPDLPVYEEPPIVQIESEVVDDRLE